MAGPESGVRGGPSLNRYRRLRLPFWGSRDVGHEDRQMEINCVIALDLSSSADSGPRAMHTVNGPIGSSGPIGLDLASRRTMVATLSGTAVVKTTTVASVPQVPAFSGRLNHPSLGEDGGIDPDRQDAIERRRDEDHHDLGR